MDVEREIDELRRRMDEGERGEFRGYTKRLIDDFYGFVQDMTTRVEALEKAERDRLAVQGFKLTRKQRIAAAVGLFTVSTGSAMAIIRFVVDPIWR